MTVNQVTFKKKKSHRGMAGSLRTVIEREKEVFWNRERKGNYQKLIGSASIFVYIICQRPCIISDFSNNFSRKIIYPSFYIRK
jgi:hypothetical protein